MQSHQNRYTDIDSSVRLSTHPSTHNPQRTFCINTLFVQIGAMRSEMLQGIATIFNHVRVASEFVHGSGDLC
jgi:hypothetical protein